MAGESGYVRNAGGPWQAAVSELAIAEQFVLGVYRDLRLRADIHGVASPPPAHAAV